MVMGAPTQKRKKTDCNVRCNLCRQDGLTSLSNTSGCSPALQCYEWERRQPQSCWFVSHGSLATAYEDVKGVSGDIGCWSQLARCEQYYINLRVGPAKLPKAEERLQEWLAMFSVGGREERVEETDICSLPSTVESRGTILPFAQ